MENKKRILKWIEALESGLYEQGRGQLVDHEDKFCCLGVACNVAIENGAPLHWKYSKGHYMIVAEKPRDKHHAFMNHQALEWYGLDDYFYQEEYCSMNDQRKKTFKQIAGKLRKQFNLPKKRGKK